MSEDRRVVIFKSVSGELGIGYLILEGEIPQRIEKCLGLKFPKLPAPPLFGRDQQIEVAMYPLNPLGQEPPTFKMEHVIFYDQVIPEPVYCKFIELVSKIKVPVLNVVTKRTN
jgi:hypothetical protein